MPHFGDKSVSSAERPVLARETAAAKILEVPLQQMLGGHPANDHIRRKDFQNSKVRLDIAQVDDREPAAAHQLDRLLGRGARDDAIAVPTLQQAEGVAVEFVLLEADRPWTVGTKVAGNAFQDPTSIYQGRFDIQRYTRSFRHERAVCKKTQK